MKTLFFFPDTRLSPKLIRCDKKVLLMFSRYTFISDTVLPPLNICAV